MRTCKECGIDIASRHGLAKYCKKCSPFIKKKQTKESDLKRTSRNKYFKYYNKNRRIGTGSIGCRLFRDGDGKLNFYREQKIVHNEKTFLMRKINLFRKIIHRDFFYSNDNDKILSPFISFISYEPLVCQTCISGNIVIPEIPRSCDYNNDGLLMPFCNNCGVVPNE